MMPPRLYALLTAVMLATLAGPGLAAAGETRDQQIIDEGERLVHNMDCDVCHTPKVMTPEGPRPDMSRRLSGHPADEALPPLPGDVLGAGGWGGLFNRDLTAWVGPWGVSFASNLTPDEHTGIGSWSKELFVESMRTGTRPNEIRPYLPPMPTYNRLTDDELHRIFLFLRSIPPVANAVPEPVSPAAAATP